MKTEYERLSWTRFQAELIMRTMRRLRADPDLAREREWGHSKLEFHQQKLSKSLAEIERIKASLNSRLRSYFFLRRQLGEEYSTLFQLSALPELPSVFAE